MFISSHFLFQGRLEVVNMMLNSQFTLKTAFAGLPDCCVMESAFVGFSTASTAFSATRFRLNLCPRNLPILQSHFRSVTCRSKITDFTEGFRERSSAKEVCNEIQRCYELVHNLGRGVVYLGSSRIKRNHTYFSMALELGREIANLLECTTWTGAGPGLMDAVIKGAQEARKPVGGFKIAKEAGEWTSSSSHPYLSPETYITCRFFSARKHGLVDAAIRNSMADLTAVVGLPGGIGTLDEIFEILTLIQLERIGSKYPVPFILMNYGGFYTQLFNFLDVCENMGTVSPGEVNSLWNVCNDNGEALEYLANFYGLRRRQHNS